MQYLEAEVLLAGLEKLLEGGILLRAQREAAARSVLDSVGHPRLGVSIRRGGGSWAERGRQKLPVVFELTLALHGSNSVVAGLGAEADDVGAHLLARHLTFSVLARDVTVEAAVGGRCRLTSDTRTCQRRKGDRTSS